MRTYLTLLSLTLWVYSAQAQDPGMMAAQAAAQQAQLAAQAAQQANDQMMRDAQQANQQAMQNAQASQTAWQCYRCYAATPKFSVQSGNYSAPVKVRIKDSTRGAVIYYTTDGWTPTDASTRYTGPITIESTTSLQAIAISPLGGRSRVATAVYTLPGAQPTLPIEHAVAEPSNAAAVSDNLVLARGTVVPFAFAADVSSKTAEVGDKIPLTLAADLKAVNVVVARKGTPSTATITEVDRPGMAGMPGEVFFQVDSLQAGNALIKLHGSAAKEGQDKVGKAFGLMFVPVVPVGLFVHGQEAEIKQGALFTAFVDSDTPVLPAN